MCSNWSFIECWHQFSKRPSNDGGFRCWWRSTCGGGLFEGKAINMFPLHLWLSNCTTFQANRHGAVPMSDFYAHSCINRTAVSFILPVPSVLNFKGLTSSIHRFFVWLTRTSNVQKYQPLPVGTQARVETRKNDDKIYYETETPRITVFCHTSAIQGIFVRKLPVWNCKGKPISLLFRQLVKTRKWKLLIETKFKENKLNT